MTSVGRSTSTRRMLRGGLLPALMTAAATPLVAVASAEGDGQQKRRLLRPSDLPIYDDDCHCKSHCEANVVVPAKVSQLELEVSRLRHLVLNSLNALSDTKDRAISFYETGKAHTIDTVAYLREESNLLPRIGAISFGGLTGILIGARGGFFKKLFYGSAGMGAIASLCYPKEAGQISKGAYTIAKYYAYVAYNKVEDEVRTRSKSVEAPVVTQKPQEQKDVTTKETRSSKATDKTVVSGDYGQSNPEDRDLYTTRTS